MVWIFLFVILRIFPNLPFEELNDKLIHKLGLFYALKMATVLQPLPSHPQKWALFDLDWTLIRPTTTNQRFTLSGGPLSFGTDDWAIIPGRVERLRDFVRENYTLGIITNQKYTGRRLQNAKQRVQRATDLLSIELGVPVYTMISSDATSMANTNDPNSYYRKPGTGWGYHLGFLPGSLYVGDAVQDHSRPDRGWGYSDSDRQFALNVGLPFYSPEEVFPQLPFPDGLFEIPKLVLVLVGPPGSGKSTFGQTLAQQGFMHIESDTYKSNWNHIQRAFREALRNNNKVVLDASNPNRQRRLEIIRIAREYQAPVAIVLFLNQGKWSEAPGRSPVPKIAYNRYWSRFEEPNPDLEGVPVYYQT